MLKHTTSRQLKMEFVCIGDLVPKDHLRRKISMAIGFESIREKVKGLYCADKGRPAVDPVVLFSRSLKNAFTSLRATVFRPE